MEYGYLPDIDETLETKTGICFDYAALMCAMLRCRGFQPSWISATPMMECTTPGSAIMKDKGWVDNIIGI